MPPCLEKKAPRLSEAGLFAKECEIWTAFNQVMKLHAALIKDQRFFVTTEIDLFEL